jgi:cytochrome c-type biogenesis protein CcmF
MIHKFVNPSWADSIKIWILTPWIFLTLGIMLGSIWAYYELGWGGFWFWDPVENVSLMPWFSLTALVHSIIILKKRDTFHSWVLILAIITFTLSMNGTFLVRSGILNSVHTFANDPERGFYILTFLFLLILLSLIIFFIYQPKDNSVKSFFLFSRETAISVNNWFMMFFLSAVLIGTIYPLILEITKDIKISVGAPFFNIIIIPFLVPFLFFMIFGPKLKWIKTNENLMSKKLIFNFFLSLVFSSIIYFFWGKTTLLNSIIFLLGLFLLLTLLFEFLETITKKNKVNIPRIISHFGFGLLIVSISLNTIFSVEMDINLKIGESYKFKKYELKFNSISGKVEKNFNSLLGSFSLTDPKGDISYLKPEIRIYNQPSITTSEANIKTNFFYDRFITMNNIQNSDFFNIRFQQKPMMIWIWVSALLISLGGILSVFRQKD